jgi:outer membrane protein
MAEYTAAQSELAESSKTYESEYGKINEELKAKYEEFQKVASDESTPQSIKDRRLQEIQELNQKAEQFAQTAQQELSKKQQQLMAPIQEKLINAIKAVGAEGGYTMIFPLGTAAYTATDVVDVTSLVKAKLGVKDTAK